MNHNGFRIYAVQLKLNLKYKTLKYMKSLIKKLKSLRIYAVSGSKYRFEWTVWLPLLGLLSMFYYTEFGRYRTIYFTGLIWQPYQMLCFMNAVLLCATYCY